MEKRRWALCATTLILMLPALLFGQSERGTISGLVKDPVWRRRRQRQSNGHQHRNQ